jgi:hypothetical protein
VADARPQTTQTNAESSIFLNDEVSVDEVDAAGYSRQPSAEITNDPGCILYSLIYVHY